MRFNFEARADKYAEIARALGIAEPSAPRDEVMRNKAAEALIKAISDLIDLIGLRKNLKELGGSADDVGQLVEDSLQDITMRTNPRKATPEDVAKLFEDALAG
jgi:alcohol dehydrogenase